MSAIDDYKQLLEAYPNANKFLSALKSSVMQHMPTQEEIDNLRDFRNLRDPSKYDINSELNKALNFGTSNLASGLAGVIKTGANKVSKNLNAGLLEKYLQEGKLSPEEMAQYEANALRMETPNLQKYNVQNAEAQILDTGKRARSLGFMTQPRKEQYHLSRNEWESNIPDLTKSDLGFHTGTLEQADYRGKAMSPSDYEYGIGQHIIPILQDKYANMLRLKDTGSFHADAIAPALEKKGILAKGMAKKIQNAVDDSWEMNKFFDPKMRDALKQQDIDAIKYANEQEGAGDSYAYINPSIIRSRFAAFDPLRARSSSLLAGTALGDLLLNYEPSSSGEKQIENYAQGGHVEINHDTINDIMQQFESEYGLRPDGSEKGRGYLNELKRPDGEVMTEYSIGLPVEGVEMDVPTLVPSLNIEEIKTLLNLPERGRIPESIVKKAAEHAEKRVKSGKSVWATPEESEYGEK